MRAAASEENLSRYRIDPKQLEKNKLHKASYEGDLNKVNRLVQPSTIDRPDQQRRVSSKNQKNDQFFIFIFIRFRRRCITQSITEISILLNI